MPLNMFSVFAAFNKDDSFVGIAYGSLWCAYSTTAWVCSHEVAQKQENTFSGIHLYWLTVNNNSTWKKGTNTS